MIEEKTATKIKALSALTINRISAGEVIERPAAAVKELVENSLDAGSTEITVKIESGGKNLILVSDNGCGMTKEDLNLSIERHTTSKLKDDNLLDIKYFGFRGEALPSIASVSRMNIKTSVSESEEGWELTIVGGEKQNLHPIAPNKGTIIEIRDLFFATPARLKFLRSEKTENQHITDLIKKISAANPSVRFSLFIDQKLTLDCPVTELINPLHDRVSQIFNKNFIDNSIEVSKSHQDMSLKGYISLPTYNKGNANDYYIYVNNRPVKDKLILAAIRVAYHDFLSRDRYPVTVLFLNINSDLVDVNVHPAKTEVRFRDPQTVRSFIIHSLREALQNDGGRTSSTIAQDTLEAIKTENLLRNTSPIRNAQYRQSYSSYPPIPKNSGLQQTLNDVVQNFNKPTVRSFEEKDTQVLEEQNDYPLGAARCQLHETYIISQTPESIIIVDQHAAHERLMYEKLKNQMEHNGIEKQRLLMPEIVEVSESTLEKLISTKDKLSSLGLTIDQCTATSIIVTEVPHLLTNCNSKKLLQDIIDDIESSEESSNLKELVNHTLGTYACHHSIRSGRKMDISEMNQLLREMESTPHSGQCNHGRPTYIELELKDIERLFGRS